MKSLSPDDLGKKLLVEECQCLSISTFTRKAKRELKKSFMELQIQVFGNDIRLATSHAHFGGLRFWFKCPMCSYRMGTLFIHPISQKIGCRRCLGLRYRKQAFKGMVENEIGR